MARTKRSASQQQDNTKKEARPIGQGKDPLAEGDRLYNETNTEAETHYKSDNPVAAEEKANKINGQNANQRAEQHNAQAVRANQGPANQDQDALYKAANKAGRPGR